MFVAAWVSVLSMNLRYIIKLYAAAKQRYSFNLDHASGSTLYAATVPFLVPEQSALFSTVKSVYVNKKRI